MTKTINKQPKGYKTTLEAWCHIYKVSPDTYRKKHQSFTIINGKELGERSNPANKQSAVRLTEPQFNQLHPIPSTEAQYARTGKTRIKAANPNKIKPMVIKTPRKPRDMRCVVCKKRQGKLKENVGRVCEKCWDKKW